MSIRKQISEERKRLQKEGLLPEWYTTQGWSLFKQKYAVEGEAAFKGRAKTISKTAAGYLPDTFYGLTQRQWANKFYNLIWDGTLSCSTPVLSNTGTDKGMSVSCSGTYVGDSIDGFYSALKENAILSKNGFGTSAYLGDIRPRGSAIGSGGKAHGLFPVFEDQVTMASKVSQGGTRRGSVASYLPIMHGDFMEVFEHVYDTPDEVNVGFNWYDEDTISMNNGDEETIKRFKKLMKLRMVQGKGYIFKPDTVNRLSPPMYKDKGLEVKASNLCVKGDTLIQTLVNIDGIEVPMTMTIESFVMLWEVGAFKEAPKVKTEKGYNKVSAAAKTGESNRMYKITDEESGKSIECTPDHQIYTENRGWVMAKDLKEDDKLNLST